MLNLQSYLIREHVGLFKLSDTYDIFDPNTQMQIGIAQEKPSLLVHILRIVFFILSFFPFIAISKRNLPTKVMVYAGNNPEDESKRLFSIERGFNLFRARIDICDHKGEVMGYLQNKLITVGCSFYIFDASGQQIAFVQGNWIGWNFHFLDQAENELGTISKQWAGVGKELLTSADNYVISFHQHPSPAQAALLLAAGLAVDTFYKE